MALEPNGTNIRIATWNVLSAAAPGAVDNIDEELAAAGVMLAGIQETGLPRAEFNTTNFRWWTEGPVARGRRGVAILVRRGQDRVRVLEHATPHPNVMMARVELAGARVMFVTCHIPNMEIGRRRGTIDAVTAVLLATAGPEEWLVAAGDFNAHIGTDNLEEQRALGRDAFIGPRLGHRDTNALGEALIALARTHQLSIWTTMERANECTRTWRAGDRQSQIDLVLGDYQYARASAGVQATRHRSDHKLIVTVLRAPPKLP